MQHESTSKIQPGDVIRARRFGNKTVGNYVIDRIARFQPVAEQGGFAAYAHREYGSFDERFMTFHVETIRVIRSYR